MAARKNAAQEDTEEVEELREDTNAAQAEAAERATKPARKRGDETVPGGKYRVNGVLVNAHGQPL
jgi:hypothetical protein